MIKQTFKVNNQIILTLFHREFYEYPKARKIEEKLEVGNYTIYFRECWVEPDETFEIQYDTSSSQFLEVENEKNPYSSLCCNYEEYIIIEKTEICKALLKDITVYRKLCEFVQEYSGYDLLKSPYSVNNTLIFTKTEISVEKSKNDGMIKITLNKPDDYEVLINFKYKVKNKIVKILSFTTSENIITFPDKDGWDLFDMEIYHENIPVYFEQDISWIEHIQISMSLVTKRQEIDLRHEKRKVVLQEHSSEIIKIGEPISRDLLAEYSFQNQTLKNKLNTKYKFEILTENEYGRALDIFKEITSNPTFNELWIFDPYFVDIQSGFAKNYDIMAILSTNLNMKKYIVYEQSKGKIEQYKESIKDLLKVFSTSSTSLKLIGTQKHFHDRFIFLKNSKRILGYQLGTSFNSFGENYSTISELTDFDSRNVFEILHKNILPADKTIIEVLVK